MSGLQHSLDDQITQVALCSSHGGVASIQGHVYVAQDLSKHVLRQSDINS